MKLGCLRALLPDASMLILTATMPFTTLQQLKGVLLLEDAKMVLVSPNRPNIYLEKCTRLASKDQRRSYMNILGPIARRLNVLRDQYPLTIIYMKLKYCGIAFRIFTQYVDESYSEEAGIRLFSQFHAHTTSTMKLRVIKELNKRDSFLRVVFATTALGMGVNTYFVEKVIHITPPSSLESYFQEIGRAGRSGCQASAQLFFNNSDIAANTHVQPEMRQYCEATGCMRSSILRYFGFDLPEKQSHCCSNCDPPIDQLTDDLADLETNVPCRAAPLPFVVPFLKGEISHLLVMVEEGFEYCNYFNTPLDENCVELIIDGIEYIDDMYSLLQYGICDEQFLSMIYNVIDYYCPL